MMESGLPLFDSLLQQTLRSICSSSNSSSSSKWVYAVFWRIVPRNFPPPRWEFGGTALDRSKGNKRNWILVWEDGFCDINECEQGRTGYLNDRFGADIFFKMCHEVYNYGEGLLGKVAADNSHKWVYSDTKSGCEPSYIGSWNASTEHQPRAWEFQLNSSIQTIAVIAVKEGLVQLGSFNKIAEDLNLVINIQRKFIYLQSIPCAIQRPYLPIQHPIGIAKPNFMMIESNDIALSAYNFNQLNILHEERSNYFPMRAINLGRNPPQNGIAGPPIWPGPPSFPNMSCSLGSLLSKLPFMVPSYNHIQVPENNRINSTGQRVEIEDCGFHIADDCDHRGRAES